MNRYIEDLFRGLELPSDKEVVRETGIVKQAEKAQITRNANPAWVDWVTNGLGKNNDFDSEKNPCWRGGVVAVNIKTKQRIAITTTQSIIDNGFHIGCVRTCVLHSEGKFQEGNHRKQHKGFVFVRGNQPNLEESINRALQLVNSNVNGNQKIIWVGTNVKTGETIKCIGQKALKDAGFTPPGVTKSANSNKPHKGYIWRREPLNKPK